VRRICTTTDVAGEGITRSTLAWGLRTGRWQRVARGVFVEGPAPPDELDRARARVLATNGAARGALAGVLHGFDGVVLDERPIRRRRLDPEHVLILHGVPCADPLRALVDLAAILDDDAWEQALESALRHRLTTVAALTPLVDGSNGIRRPEMARMRRVLARRPTGAAPTESLLETLMVQLVRDVPGLGDPVSQLVIAVHGDVVARVDLAWPNLGLFVELDGHQHKGQPLYDARRESAVVAATGWLCARFTWHEVVHVPRATTRRLAAIVEQCGRRPIPGGPSSSAARRSTTAERT
jgi:hypothetical protein